MLESPIEILPTTLTTLWWSKVIALDAGKVQKTSFVPAEKSTTLSLLELDITLELVLPDIVSGDASLTGTTATITGRTQVKIEGSMIYLN